MKTALARRNILNREIDGVYYFPFANGKTLTVKMLDCSPFVYNDSMKSISFNIRPTTELSDKLNSCYFEAKDLLGDQLFDILESTLPELRNSLATPEVVNLINSVLTADIKDDSQSRRLLTGLFDKFCPNASQYLHDTFDFYEDKDTTQRVQLFLMSLLLFTTTKSLSAKLNERHKIQKPVMLTGSGQTGKSSILELFRILSLNSSQAAEVGQLGNRFESFA